MRAVVQRVREASVLVDDITIGRIERGLLVFLGIMEGDGVSDADYICDKVVGLRVFDDENDVPNLSVSEVEGGVLLISQFTLCADARHGRRPSYSDAARPEAALPLYEYAAERIARAAHVETGRFQAYMQVALVNDGPHTILLDSRRIF